MTSLCQRLRIKGVETVVLKETDEPPAGPFDAAVVDVPCSNTAIGHIVLRPDNGEGLDMTGSDAGHAVAAE